MLSLLIQNISDQLTRENFFRIVQWSTSEPLLNCDFKFFEVDIPSANTNFPIRHGLGFVPKDLILLSAIGDQNYYFLYNSFDKTTIYVNAAGPVRLRFVAGAYASSTINNTSANFPFVAPTGGGGGGGITALTGDVTASGTGSVVATISANAVTNAKLAQMATLTIKGNNTGGTANASDLTVTQVTAMLNSFVGDSGSGGTKGLVLAPSAGDAAAGKFLKADGTWAVPSYPTVPQTFMSDTSWSGSATSLVVTVSSTISDARKAIWQLCDNANNYDRIWCSIKATSSTQVTITVSPALPAGTYRLLGVST